MKRTLILFILSVWCVIAVAQQVNIEEVGNAFKNKPVKINGGLSAGSVFYEGSQQSGRQPWTYYLNGNVNFSFFDLINIPLSVNLTNLGTNMSYPSLPNRLSLHPTYKWATAHIGDVSMTFSPYTLNGHQFTGGGVDLSPGKFKISAMGGRLLRKVSFDSENSSVLPNYTRYGYGLKTQYEGTKYTIGLSYFGGQDIKNNTMQFQMDSLGILPAQNNVFGLNTNLNVIRNLTLSIEYAVSLLTRDMRAEKNDDWLGNILGKRTSTNTYHAFNTRLSYQLKKNTIGVGYERIDPDYKTLGAYYFNNDYENITLNFARPFLKGDKANIAVSAGVQRDDLKKQKAESTQRYVGSANLNYNPLEDLQMSFNYSTFQSYRNLKSQFDYINELNPYENTDTLNFTQLSQNLDGSVMYTFQKSESRNQRLNLNVSFQTAADQQGEFTLPGNVTRFLNSALGYGYTLIPHGLNITTSANVSYNYGGMIESYTFGPMLGVTKSFFSKTFMTGISSSYNVNMTGGNTNAKVLNLRCNASYRLKKNHNFNANFVWQNRAVINRPVTDAFTTTIGYSYSF